MYPLTKKKLLKVPINCTEKMKSFIRHVNVMNINRVVAVVCCTEIMILLTYYDNLMNICSR
jgi:hypothetical protein